MSFTGDLVGNIRDDTGKVAKLLEKSANKVGLKINVEKTKTMELLDTEANIADPDD